MEEAISPFDSFKQDTNEEYANFWSRVAAYLIDNMIISLVSLILPFVPAVIIYLAGHHAVASLLTYFVGFYIVLFLFGWLYHCLLESSAMEATIGKKLIKVVLVDEQMNPVGFWQATIRHFVSALLTFFIGAFAYITAAFTDKKQGLHDMVAKTYVIVDNRESSVPIHWNLLLMLIGSILLFLMLLGLLFYFVMPNTLTFEQIL